MAKCAGKQCSCVGNTCEHECNKTEDCLKEGHWCFSSRGHDCTCKHGLCEGIRRPLECPKSYNYDKKGTEVCLKKKLCSPEKSCTCIHGYCGPPWFAEDKNKACHEDEDCEESLGMCFGGKCSCKGAIKWHRDAKGNSISEESGICQLKTKGIKESWPSPSPQIKERNEKGKH